MSGRNALASRNLPYPPYRKAMCPKCGDRVHLLRYTPINEREKARMCVPCTEVQEGVNQFVSNWYNDHPNLTPEVIAILFKHETWQEAMQRIFARTLCPLALGPGELVEEKDDTKVIKVNFSRFAPKVAAWSEEDWLSDQIAARQTDQQAVALVMLYGTADAIGWDATRRVWWVETARQEAPTGRVSELEQLALDNAA